MSLQKRVDDYLIVNYTKIENDRNTLDKFRWKPISDKIGEGLSPEYIRNRFRVIRKQNDDTIIDIDTPKVKLFIDIETSFNIVFSWGLGNKVRLTPENIIEERKIICISYAFENQTARTLSWHNGDESKMLIEFAKVLAKADIIIGHNSDAFDIKHLRTRFIYHGIPFPTKLQTIDTLKMARANFKFNSNKLDYIAKYLNVGEKQETGGVDLWKKIILQNDKEALKKMVSYCENDVNILQKVYHRLQEFTQVKKFRRN